MCEPVSGDRNTRVFYLDEGSFEKFEKDKKQDIVEYYIDLLIFGTEEDWLWFKKTEERWCKEIERRVGTKIA